MRPVLWSGLLFLCEAPGGLVWRWLSWLPRRLRGRTTLNWRNPAEGAAVCLGCFALLHVLLGVGREPEGGFFLWTFFFQLGWMFRWLIDVEEGTPGFPGNVSPVPATALGRNYRLVTLHDPDAFRQAAGFSFSIPINVWPAGPIGQSCWALDRNHWNKLISMRGFPGATLLLIARCGPSGGRHPRGSCM